MGAVDVDVIHFLVHPGFTWQFKEKYGDRFGHYLGAKEFSLEEDLVGVYRAKVDSIAGRNGEVLVVFSPAPASDYWGDLRSRERWTEAERYAKERLGRRCLAMSNPDILGPEFMLYDEPFAPKSKSLRDVRDVLGRRGYRITAATKCEVWGSSVPACVAKAAGHISAQLGLSELVIPLSGTNYFRQADSITEAELRELEERVRRKSPSARVVARR